MPKHDEMYCKCQACQTVRERMFRKPVAVGVQEQPDPLPNQSTPIINLVVADMIARKQEGLKKYGVALQAGNGRDALVDAYHEALDMCMYLRQAIEERG